MFNQDDDIVRIATARNPAEAHIWQQALSDEGIKSQVVGDFLDAGLGDIPGMRAELWVLQSDAERAQQILESPSESADENPDAG
jgi:hypothetical protein